MVTTYVSPFISLGAVHYSGTGTPLLLCFIAKTANTIVSTLTVLTGKYLDNSPWSHSRCREWPGIESKSLDFLTTLFVLCPCKCQETRFKDKNIRLWLEKSWRNGRTMRITRLTAQYETWLLDNRRNFKGWQGQTMIIETSLQDLEFIWCHYDY